MINPISFKGSVVQKVTSVTALEDTNQTVDKKRLNLLLKIHDTDILAASLNKNDGVDLVLLDSSKVSTASATFISEEILKSDVEFCNPKTNIRAATLWTLNTQEKINEALKPQLEKVNKYLMALTKNWIKKTKK